MKSTASVINLIKLYLKLEWRQKFAFQGVLVQMFTSVFLIFLSMSKIALPVWNALFWLMVLFNTINAIAKGFLQETDGKMLYYHSVCKPEALILSKIIFNALSALLLLLVFSLVYAVVLGFPVHHPNEYFLCAVLFTIGLSTVFTMVSAIASGGGNAILIPVLGLPLMLPLLLITVKAAKKAMDGVETLSVYYDLAALMLMDVMVLYLSVLLYRYLWKN